MMPLECERGTTGDGPATDPAAAADDAAPPPSDSAWFLNTLMASSSLSSIRDVAYSKPKPPQQTNKQTNRKKLVIIQFTSDTVAVDGHFFKNKLNKSRKFFKKIK